MLCFVYFKKLLNEFVGKYLPSEEKVFKNLNKYTVDDLMQFF